MSDLSHLRLENTASPLPYTSTQRGGRDFRLPPRDRAPHAGRLIGELHQARTQVDAVRQQPPVNDEIDGYPLTLRSDPGFTLKLDSLDRQRDGMELLSVRSEQGVQVASIFVRRDKLVSFVRLIERYRDKETPKGKFRNQKLWGHRARYSLVISIETPEVDVDLYTQIVNQATVSAEIQL